MSSLSLVSLLAMLLIVCRRGALARSLADLDSDSVEWTHATGGGGGRRGPAHFSELPLSKREELAESHAPCVSVREREAPLQCADRRSRFNYNPFGLRFGKRAQQPVGSLARPRTITFLKLLPLVLNPRELEVAN